MIVRCTHISHIMFSYKVLLLFSDDGGWETWREWYSCPVTCGGGTQYRYRLCNNPLVYCNGALCPGCAGGNCANNVQESTDPRFCNTLDCNGM